MKDECNHSFKLDKDSLYFYLLAINPLYYYANHFYFFEKKRNLIIWGNITLLALVIKELMILLNLFLYKCNIKQKKIVMSFHVLSKSYYHFQGAN